MPQQAPVYAREPLVRLDFACTTVGAHPLVLVLDQEFAYRQFTVTARYEL